MLVGLQLDQSAQFWNYTYPYPFSAGPYFGFPATPAAPQYR